MEELFNGIIEVLNEKFTNLNNILVSISKVDQNLNALVSNYFNNIASLSCEPYELKYPYEGMKEEVKYVLSIINNLVSLAYSFRKSNLQIKEFDEAFQDLLLTERKLYTIYTIPFLEPFAWANWYEFVDEKLKNRNELANALILAIDILQSEDPTEILDEFYDTEIIDFDMKTDILDFMADYHIEQTYIKDYFNQKIVYNFADMIGHAR